MNAICASSSKLKWHGSVKERKQKDNKRKRKTTKDNERKQKKTKEKQSMNQKKVRDNEKLIVCINVQKFLFLFYLVHVYVQTRTVVLIVFFDLWGNYVIIVMV